MTRMDLGNFSISLAVKDTEASQRFYEKLAFKQFAGDPAQNWLILKNGDHAIGRKYHRGGQLHGRGP
jgi:lactoylglutathione lyase